uniref:Uncharacterized protein n=1 Tax=Avena sativa TaxID=4498 RepID=A0ACD5Z7W7_AVESA
MKNAPTIVCALAMSLAAATMLSTGAAAAAACARDPSMSIAAACNKTTAWQGPRGKPAFELCKKTLQGAPESGTASAYGIVAAKAALESCAATERAAGKLLQDPKLPEDLRASYGSCVDMYSLARTGVTAMGDALKTCSTTGLLRGFADANAAVNDCLQVLRLVEDGGVASPLHRMVLADRDRITLACFLGALIPDSDK